MYGCAHGVFGTHGPGLSEWYAKKSTHNLILKVDTRTSHASRARYKQCSVIRRWCSPNVRQSTIPLIYGWPPVMKAFHLPPLVASRKKSLWSISIVIHSPRNKMKLYLLSLSFFIDWLRGSLCRSRCRPSPAQTAQRNSLEILVGSA